MSYFQDLAEKASCTRVGPFGEPYNVMIMGQFTEILPSATKCMGSRVWAFFCLFTPGGQTWSGGGNVIMAQNLTTWQIVTKFLTFDISDITNFSCVCSLFVLLSTERRSLENILQLASWLEKIYRGEMMGIGKLPNLQNIPIFHNVQSCKCCRLCKTRGLCECLLWALVTQDSVLKQFQF